MMTLEVSHWLGREVRAYELKRDGPSTDQIWPAMAALATELLGRGSA
jgi:hypothetical protein